MAVKNVVCVAIFFLVIVFGWVFQTGIGLERTALDPGYYHVFLEEADVGNLRDYFLKDLSEKLQHHLIWNEPLIEKALEQTVEEEWIIGQATMVIDQYLSFIKGEQEELLIVIDMRERLEIFKAEIKRELKRNAPPAVEQYSEEFLEEIFSQFELPAQLILIDTEENEVFAPELSTSLSIVARSRAYLHYVPLVSLAALALLSALWFGIAGTLKLIGVSILVSGISYFYLWKAAWGKWLVPVMDNLAGSNRWLALVWSGEGSQIFLHSEMIMNQISIAVIGTGLVIMLAGLLVGIFKRIKR